MRIGIDLSPVTTTPTGVGRYTAAVLDRMLERGDHQWHGLSSGSGTPDRRVVDRLDYHRRLPVPTRVLYALWRRTGRPRADRLLGGVDLYHATNYFLPPVATARRVVTLYDLSFLRNPEWSSPKIVGPFSRGVKTFAQDADAIITCSEASRRDIVELLDVASEKITVAYGAVEPGLAPLERAAAQESIAERFGIEGPFILFVGTLEARKNIKGILDAFTRLEGKVPHRLVMIGGDGWGTEAFDEGLASGMESGRVLRLGYLPERTDLPRFYSAADAFLFPSFYEGFGLPVLEALACGCPTLTSNISSLPEVGGDAALYTDPNDAEITASQLLRLLEDTDLQTRLRAAGPVQAARFSWDDAADATLGVYGSLA